MNLLERYLKQIERYLPFKERKETIKELRNLILDQVDGLVQEGLSQEKAIFNIIVEMGEPRDVAAKYFDSRPIISKEMEPVLEMVLKIVSITLPLVVIFAQSIEFVFSSSSVNIMDVLLHIAYSIPSALYSLLVAYGFIFIIFYLLQKYVQPKFEVEAKIFNPHLLPEIPVKVFKITLFESILGILFTCLALYLFNMNPGLIAVYYNGGSVPLLNENFDKVLMFMNIGWFVSIGLYIYYLFKRRKNITTKTIELFHKIYGAVVVIILATSNVFNEVVLVEYNLGFIPNMFKIGFIFLGIAIIIGSIVEYVKMFVNLDALEELSKKES